MVKGRLLLVLNTVNLLLMYLLKQRVFEQLITAHTQPKRVWVWLWLTRHFEHVCTSKYIIMPITSAQFFLRRPRPRSPVGLDFWTFISQPSQRYTWPSETAGVECHCPIAKLHPFQEILRAYLFLVMIPHIQRIIVPSLRCRWCRSNKVGAQVSLLPIQCDLCHWSAIYQSGLSSTPFTPETGIGLQSTRGTITSIVDPTRITTTENGFDTHGIEIYAELLKHIESWPRYQDPRFAHVDPKSLSFHVSLPEDQFFLQFFQWFRDDDQVILIQVFIGTSSTKLLGEASRTVMNSRCSDKSRGEHPLSYWTLPDTSLALWQLYDMSMWCLANGMDYDFPLQQNLVLS